MIKTTLLLLLTALTTLDNGMTVLTEPLGKACAIDASYKAILAKDGKACANAYLDAINDTDNIRPDMREELAPIVAAIRHAENGPSKPLHKEYGILHERAYGSYRSQAGWCAATVQKTYDRWIKHDKKIDGKGEEVDFITYLGDRYAPTDAENDPNGLNKNWVPNVSYFHRKILVDCDEEKTPTKIGRQGL